MGYIIQNPSDTRLKSHIAHISFYHDLFLLVSRSFWIFSCTTAIFTSSVQNFNRAVWRERLSCKCDIWRDLKFWQYDLDFQYIKGTFDVIVDSIFNIICGVHGNQCKLLPQHCFTSILLHVLFEMNFEMIKMLNQHRFIYREVCRPYTFCTVHTAENILYVVHEYSKRISLLTMGQIRKIAGCACAKNAGNVFPLG